MWGLGVGLGQEKHIGGEVRKSKERAMAAHSSVPAWRTPGTGELGGLPSVGSHRVGHD